MQLRESALPGFGKKYVLTLKTGDQITIVLHQSGQREISITLPREEDPLYALSLTDEEARELAFILGGVRYQPLPSDKINLIFSQLVMEWVPVEKGCTLQEKTLADLAVRRQTGVSVIAILRGETIIPTPDPYQEKIQAGDTLVAVGTLSQIEAFVNLCIASS